MGPTSSLDVPFCTMVYKLLVQSGLYSTHVQFPAPKQDSLKWPELHLKWVWCPLLASVRTCTHEHKAHVLKAKLMHFC